jgi:hypothetical protein
MLPGAANLPPEGPFDPELRCCTYHPQLLAHLCGGILRDGDAAGRAHLRERIAARVGVTPIGIIPTPAYAAHHQALSGIPGSFGHRRELRCPFLQDDHCSIWRHRGLACAAFHCKYDRGALGHWRWNLIVVAFNVVDRVVSRWLLERQGLDVRACDALLHGSGDEAAAWGAFLGREEEYFLEAARLVEALSWDDVVAIGGAELAGYADGVRAALARLDEVPARVRKGPNVLYQIRPDRSALAQHPSVSLDLIELPADVVDLLAKLDEAPLADLGLPPDLQRRLLDWQVLIGV